MLENQVPRIKQLPSSSFQLLTTISIFRPRQYTMETKDTLLTKFNELKRKNAEALLGGGEKRIEQQHAKGKLTARERVNLLMDEGSFEELGKFVMHRSKDFGLD